MVFLAEQYPDENKIRTSEKFLMVKEVNSPFYDSVWPQQVRKRVRDAFMTSFSDLKTKSCLCNFTDIFYVFFNDDKTCKMQKTHPPHANKILQSKCLKS